MSYLVLARKWRPQTFDDVVGQEHITQTFKNAVKNGKLAQAYLFVGPRGVGKTSCARILAKSLNCTKAPTITPCGTCSVCREIAEGRSLDVIEIDGASNRGIDEIRTLRENVKFAASFGSYKIYIIDEVHMLTQEAFNALLKTLEEPPEHVKFVFATTRPDKVLPTILSRCQRFEFHRIPTLKIIAKLQEIAKAEKVTIEKEVFFDIARLSDGSMRDAESVLDQLISFSRGKITAKDIVAVMGLIEQDVYFDFVDALAKKDAQQCITFIAELLQRGKDMAKLLNGLLWHMRNLMLAKIMRSNLEELMDLPADIITRITQQAQAMTLQQIVHIFSSITSTQEMAKKIGSYRVPLEVMVIRLTQLEEKPMSVSARSASPSTLPPSMGAAASHPAKKIADRMKLDNVGSLFIGKRDKETRHAVKPEQVSQEKKAGEDVHTVTSTTHQEPQKPTAAVSRVCVADFSRIVNQWGTFVEAVGKQKMSVATYLRDSKPLRINQESLVIGFPKRSLFYKEAIEQKHNQKLLADMITHQFHMTLNIICELYEQKEPVAEDLEDEYVKSVIDTFQGRMFERS